MSDHMERLGRVARAIADEQAADASYTVTEPLTPIVRIGVAEGYPQVKGRCPACGWSTLFVGAGGYITCSYLPCPNPGAASDLLSGTHRTTRNTMKG